MKTAVEPGRRSDQFVLSIDIAPTVVATAGAAVPRGMQGRSLEPLLLGQPTEWRNSFLVEYYGHENPFPWIANLDYRAVRLDNYKYIRWIRQDDADELYDLEANPFEQRNLADDTAHADVVARARDLMASLVLKSLGLPTTSRM